MPSCTLICFCTTPGNCDFTRRWGIKCSACIPRPFRVKIWDRSTGVCQTFSGKRTLLSKMSFKLWLQWLVLFSWATLAHSLEWLKLGNVPPRSRELVYLQTTAYRLWQEFVLQHSVYMILTSNSSVIVVSPLIALMVTLCSWYVMNSVSLHNVIHSLFKST